MKGAKVDPKQVEHDVLTLATRDGDWWSFYHECNIAAARLHSRGYLERRRFDRPEGGFEYRITDAGRSALTEQKP